MFFASLWHFVLPGWDSQRSALFSCPSSLRLYRMRIFCSPFWRDRSLLSPPCHLARQHFVSIYHFDPINPKPGGEKRVPTRSRINRSSLNSTHSLHAIPSCTPSYYPKYSFFVSVGSVHSLPLALLSSTALAQTSTARVAVRDSTYRIRSDQPL